jgi:hypothetical protein
MPMRAVVLCALFAFSSRAAPVRSPFSERSCEDECRAQGARDHAECDVRPAAEADRSFCHQNVGARLDVCLRLCEE